MNTPWLSRRNMIIACIALLIAYNWFAIPTTIEVGEWAQSLERRSGDYSLVLADSTSFTDVFDLDVFEGYHPSIHFDFEDRVCEAPSRHVSDEQGHYFTEYVLGHGRMQFHTSYDDEYGAAHWIEYLPRNLSVDSFVKPKLGVHLDLGVEKPFTLYAKSPGEHLYLTASIKDGRATSVFWSSN